MGLVVSLKIIVFKKSVQNISRPFFCGKKSYLILLLSSRIVSKLKGLVGFSKDCFIKVGGFHIVDAGGLLINNTSMTVNRSTSVSIGHLKNVNKQFL